RPLEPINASTREAMVSAALDDSCWLMIDTHNVWNGSRFFAPSVQGPCFSTMRPMMTSRRRCFSARRITPDSMVMDFAPDCRVPTEIECRPRSGAGVTTGLRCPHAFHLLRCGAHRGRQGFAVGIPDAARSAVRARRDLFARRLLLPVARVAGEGREPVRPVR